MKQSVSQDAGPPPMSGNWGSYLMKSFQNIELKTLVRRIESRMAELGTNAKQVSKKSGLGNTAVYDLINGKNLRPALPVIRAMAKTLDCDLSYLVGEQDAPRRDAVFGFSHDSLFQGPDAELINLAELDKSIALPLTGALEGRRGEFWQLTSDVMAGAGYLRGDFLVVDFDQPPRARDIVLAITDGKNATFRLYLPPYLYAAPIGASPAPMVADGYKTIVRGVVVSRYSLSQ